MDIMKEIQSHLEAASQPLYEAEKLARKEAKRIPPEIRSLIELADAAYMKARVAVDDFLDPDD